MAGASRLPSASVSGTAPHEGGVLRQLFQKPEEFSFVQAVRILYHAYGNGRTILDFMREDVRVRPHLSLGFPTTDIVSLERLSGGGPRFRLTVSMLGLYGASSPMPAFYTDDLLSEDNEDRSGLRAFMDIVNDGFYSHYLHAGWFRYRILSSVGEQKNASILECFFAPGGMAEPSLFEKGRKRYNFVPLVSGLSRFPRSAAGLEAYLAGILKVPVHVEQCVPRRARVPKDQQCRLGMGHRLGESAVIGTEIYDVMGKACITIGPAPRDVLAQLVPKGKHHESLHHLHTFYCTEPLHFDLRLILDTKSREKGGVGSFVLGNERHGRLGCDTWLALPKEQYGEAFFPGGKDFEKTVGSTRTFSF